MRKLLPILALLCFATQVHAQISFDNAADLGYTNGASPLTASFTVGSGSNRILYVGFVGDTIGGEDDITGVTYNGTSMTLAVKNTTDPSGGGGNRYTYLYALENPSSGAHNVVISWTGSHYVLAGASSYAGAKQTGQPEATNTATTAAANSITASVTTITNNDWTILFAQYPPRSPWTPFTAGSGSTRRAYDATYGSWAFFDSNAAITPAGSTSMTANCPGPYTQTALIAAFAPVAVASVVPHLTLLGVGP